MSSPYTLIGFNSAASLGTPVTTTLSTTALTLIGTSPAYPVNAVTIFGTNQSGSYDTFNSLWVGPSGSQQLVIPNGGHGNANPMGFAEKYYLQKSIPPSTQLWINSVYVTPAAGNINISLGVAWEDIDFKPLPIQYLGNASPPGTLLTSGSIANTMGAWVEMGTLMGNARRIKISFYPYTYTNSGILYVGLGTSPTAPLFSIPMNSETGYAFQGSVEFGCKLPPGTILSCAYQTTGTSLQASAWIHTY